MSVSAVSPLAISRTTTDSIDQKTVHKKDISRLSDNIKNVIQSASKMQRILENPKTSSFSKPGYRGEAGKIGLEMIGKFKEVKACRAEIKSSSYNYADFKDKKLEKLEGKLLDAMKSLDSVCERGKEAESFAGKRLAMYNETQKHTNLEKQQRTERIRSGADEYNGGFVH